MITQTSPSQATPKPSLLPVWVSLGLALAYFLYSLKSKGFYQQDEANHYLSMLRFWYDPQSIMGNWAKPGYKILYVVTALAGQKAVVFQNCLFAAFSCYFAYKSAEKLNVTNPWIAFILLATQPLWISLAFRNYSEFPAAFLLTLGYYLYLNERYIWAGLLMGWICTIRQEFYPIAAILGLSFWYRKHWIAGLAIAMLPLIQNLAGYYSYGDPLYLVNQILGTSETLKDAYARQGFDHYFLTSAVVFGPVGLTLFVGFLGIKFLKNTTLHPALLITTLGFFLINCLFNWEEVHIGPATGGNLRYMCIIAPLVAVCGALLLDEFKRLDGKFRMLFIFFPFLILVYAFLTHEHNFVKLIPDTEDPIPFVGSFFTVAALFIPLSGLAQTGLFALLCGFLALVSVKPIKLSPEDSACQETARWYKQNEGMFKNKPLYNTHIMFYYFLGKVEKQFKPEPTPISDTATMEKAPVGSLILWDSHYGYRPNYKRGVPYQYFAESPSYRQIQVFQSSDNNFAFVFFEKTGK